MTPTEARTTCLLTPQFRGMDGISAVSRQVIESLLEQRPSRKLKVWSLQDDDTSTLSWDSKQCQVMFSRSSRFRYTIHGLIAATRSVRVDVAIAMHLHLAPVALPLHVRSARLVVFLHGIEAWRRLRLSERISLQHASMIIANSEFTASRFLEANAGFERKVHICPLGLPRQTVATDPNLPFRDFALIVGRIAASERYKGHDVLIEIWHEISSRLPNAHLVIAGDGDDRARLEQKVHALGVVDHVHFLGRVSDETLTGLMNVAHSWSCLVRKKVSVWCLSKRCARVSRA